MPLMSVPHAPSFQTMSGKKILSWMDISSAIVFMPALTHWTGWELEQVIARGHVRKTVLVFPEFFRFFPFPGCRKRDARLRVAQLRERLTGTPWFAAIDKLEAPLRLRALLLHEDGDVTAIMSRPKNRSSYHIAALLAHHILITGHRSAIAPPPRASSHFERSLAGKCGQQPIATTDRVFTAPLH
jgi:hypothetical protein